MRRLFLAQYIKHIRTVGAVTPSSRFLARRMADAASVEWAQVIVEYGPGTGVFTREIVARKSPRARVVLVEQNVVFYRRLQTMYQDDDSVIVVHDSAENIEAILGQYLYGRQVDCVVSGLPFAALPTQVSRAIIEATTRVLHPNGVFVTFQYTLLKKRFFDHFFQYVTTGREYRNLPPAYVLKCWNDSE